jgi:hypothetical protein
MKRIVASLGLAALGAACVQTSNAQADPSKPWTLSAALRGFYDDNVDTAPSGGRDTFGFEITPSIGFDISGDQTSASFLYTYSYKYYDKQPTDNQDHDDQTHTISARVMHAFSERTSVSLADSFVIGQEPDVLAVGMFGFTSPQRISGENIRNYASLTVNHQFTRIFGIEVGYANSFFDYEDNISDHPSAPFGFVTRSGLLDRVEHAAHVDARWMLTQNTTFLVGYQFGLGCYTGDEVIGVFGLTPIVSGDRDYRSHTAYVGVDHTFMPDLTGSLRVGMIYYDNYAAPNPETSVQPYVKGNLRYTYARDSYLEVGVSHDRTATDVNSVNETTGSITSSAQTTTAYASITHRILADLYGSLMGTFQNMDFEGGTFQDQTEQYYILSASLEYRINRHISATASYHFDHLESNIPLSANPADGNRTYDRNRIFLGAVFTY